MNKNLEMIERKNNFFSRLLYKIRSFFKKDEIVHEDLAENNNLRANENIIEEIKISDEYKKLLDLQKGIESDEISIADISDDEAEKLIELYAKQNV